MKNTTKLLTIVFLLSCNSAFAGYLKHDNCILHLDNKVNYTNRSGWEQDKDLLTQELKDTLHDKGFKLVDEPSGYRKTKEGDLILNYVITPDITQLFTGFDTAVYLYIAGKEENNVFNWHEFTTMDSLCSTNGYKGSELCRDEVRDALLYVVMNKMPNCHLINPQGLGAEQGAYGRIPGRKMHWNNY